MYVGAQLVGAIVAAAVLWSIWQGVPGFSSEGNFGQNAFGDESGLGIAWWAAFLVEVVTTLVFLLAILAVTDERNEHPALAPLAIGLTLAMIHFTTIPLTGTSVNPARSIGPALFAGSDAIIQLWLFILAPLIGGALAGVLYPTVFGRHSEPVAGSGLRFGRRTPPGAVPGYGAPDAYQEQWNQQQQLPGPGPAARTAVAASAAATVAAAAVPHRAAAPAVMAAAAAAAAPAAAPAAPGPAPSGSALPAALAGQ